MAKTFGEQETPSGYVNGEVASALQKAIRRGEEREALHWATELDQAGFGNYVWKRLRIIATEDVGLADPEAVLLTRALWENWLDQKKADSGETVNAALFLCHAVIVLARAPKSRIVDHAYIVMYEGERPHPEVPDHAIDKHTKRGRQMGRGFDHFFREAAKLENHAGLPDEYEDEAREKLLAKPKRRRATSAAR